MNRTVIKRTVLRPFGILTLLLISLACSGVLGPNVGPHTKQLIEHLSTPGQCHSSTETPCPRLNVASGHQVGQIGDWKIQLGEPFLVEGDATLPNIKNSNERRSFKANKHMALVLPYKVLNESPVARKRNLGFRLKDTLGESRSFGPYNAALWGKELGIPSSWDLGRIPPNKWVETVTVIAVDPAGVDGAALYLNVEETRRYVTGKKYSVTAHHLLMELPEVTRREGPPPWLEAKTEE